MASNCNYGKENDGRPYGNGQNYYDYFSIVNVCNIYILFYKYGYKPHALFIGWC